MEEQMQSIRQRIKEVQDRKKSYVDAHRIERSYEVGDMSLLAGKTAEEFDQVWKGC
jgi:hypothetical protein